MAELIIQSGKLQGKRLVLPDREVFIGRDEDCHVRLSSSLISRKHCALKGTAEGLWVRDLESQNGTFVNDVQVTEAVLLKPGDILQVGAIQFQVPPLAKPAAEPSTGAKPKEKSGRISDAEIASWLTDESEKASVGPDTTIIKNPKPPVAKVESPTPAPKPAAAAAAMPAELVRRGPRTVKEHATEIIRRHWAEKRGETP